MSKAVNPIVFMQTLLRGEALIYDNTETGVRIRLWLEDGKLAADCKDAVEKVDFSNYENFRVEKREWL
jgi:hypothetical protein